jgi:hypothetical protein
MNDPYIQDPGDRLDYKIDYTAWLDGDVLTGSTWTVSPAATLSGQTSSDQVAVCWIEGLVNGLDYLMTNHVTTQLGREKERSIKIMCRDQ